MKSLCCILVILGILIFSPALANAECPLTGNIYSIELNNVTYELSNFNCTFGPGCQANCDLWYGNFDTGPLYHEQLPFVCWQNGDITIAGIPCTLNNEGNLDCLIIDTTNYHCQKFGNKTWCFPEEVDSFQFIMDGTR